MIGIINEKFNKDIQHGVIGETIVYNYLKHFDKIIDIKNVTNDKKYQDLDIDFVVKTSNMEMTVEVKYDSMFHKTGNFPYEYYSSKTYFTIGCMEKTKASRIFLLSDVTYDCYIIRTKDLQELVNNQIITDENNNVIGGNLFRFVNMGDNAKGFLIPLKQFDYYDIKYNITNLVEFV